MNRTILVMIILLTMSFNFSGCNKKNEGTSMTDNNKINLTFSFWEPSTDREMEKALSEIIEKYKTVKPNVVIKLASQPVNGYQEWIKAQFSSDNAPDIEYNNPIYINEQYKTGLIIDLKENLEKPNPYGTGKNPWKDDFAPGKLGAAHEFQGETYAIPISGLGLAYFYNVDIYDELGLKPPKTWDEMMSNFAVIDKSGINPVAFMGQKNDAVDWMSWQICTGMFGDKILGDENMNPNGDSSLNDLELTRAVATGYYDITKPGEYQDMYKQYLSMLKDYGKYAKNAAGLDEAGAKSQFLAGNAAHIFTGSWDVKSFLLNEKTPFRINTFPFPKFTEKNSPYFGENMSIVSVQPIAITNSVNKQEGKKEAAIDFLNYLTAPENYKIFAEKTYSIPTIKEVAIDPIFTAFLGESRPPICLYSIGGQINEYNDFNANLSMISGEEQDMNELLKNVQNGLSEYCQNNIKHFQLNKENNYKLDTIPFLGGAYKPSK